MANLIPGQPGPDYDPDVWALGYQQRQFGQGTDPDGRPPSAWAGLADPPAAMTTAVNLPNYTGEAP